MASRQDTSDTASTCWLCPDRGTPCEVCGNVFACEQHLKHHRKCDRSCLPVEVTNTATTGRCLVASRNIPELEKVLEDSPLVILPDVNTPPVCVSCLRRLSSVTPGHLCAVCHLPLCGDTCQGGLHDKECRVLQEAGVVMDKCGLWDYEVVATIRVLLVGVNSSLLTSMMEHLEERIQEADLWTAYQEKVVTFITSKLGGRWEEEEGQRAIGILRTNAYSLEAGDQTQFGMARLIFPVVSIMNHSCQPNTRCVVRKDFKLEVYSQTNIQEGQEMTITYLPSTFLTLPQRRTRLLNTWFFTCKCPRCSDPTEFGTHFSSTLCPSCGAPCLPSDKEEGGWEWQCGSCGKVLPQKLVGNMVDRVEKEVEELDPESCVQEAEDILERFAKILHPHHCLMLQIKARLTKVYGSEEGFLRHQMDEDDVKRKLELCEEVMSVLEALDPGQTDWKGSLVYEKNWPAMTLLQSQFSMGKISRKVYKKSVRKLIRQLQAAKRTLEIEDENSYEHKISEKISKAVFSMENLLK